MNPPWTCDNSPPIEMVLNPDINGIGVSFVFFRPEAHGFANSRKFMIGFVGTGFLIVARLIANYVVVYDPRYDSFRKRGPRAMRSQRPNLIDLGSFGMLVGGEPWPNIPLCRPKRKGTKAGKSF